MATLSLHSLFELRTCIEKGSIMLDMEASSLPQVVGKCTCLDSFPHPFLRNFFNPGMVLWMVLIKKHYFSNKRGEKKNKE